MNVERKPGVGEISNPIIFSSQLDQKYQYLVDKGIAPKVANFCWVASTEMCISTFIPNNLSRQVFMQNFVEEIAGNKEAFDSEGRFGIDVKGMDLLTKALNKTAKENKVSVAVGYIFEPTFDDFQEQLNQGVVLIYGFNSEADGNTGHVSVLDRILFQEGNYAVFNGFDPAANDASSGRRIISNREMYILHQSKQSSLLPFLITFKAIEK